MKVQHLPITSAAMFGKLLLDYIEGNPQLRPFYEFTPHISSFEGAISRRSDFPVNREVLAAEMLRQHNVYFSRFPELQSNVELLASDNTFTVTTGHQLCLATGPLYFLYKIISVISLSRQLKEKYPGFNFIPVYWMASEDHDIEEIRHVNLNGSVISWNPGGIGATGRLSTNGLGGMIEEISSIIADEPFAGEITGILKRSYLEHSNLSDATRELVLSFFGKQGLLVLDPDSHELKKLFVPVMREELSLGPSAAIVGQTTDKLSRYYKPQVSPRDINLFYLDEQLRERIVRESEGTYSVLNTDLVFGHEFITDLLEKQPERFSPNVVLRPVYQESILPNLAYVGGPGELSYWLQYKEMFGHFNVFYPVLVPRNNAVILPSRSLEKFFKTGFGLSDIFRQESELVREWLLGEDELMPLTEETKSALADQFKRLQEYMSRLDPTLTASVQAELQKALNGIDNLGKKGMAALKRRHESGLGQIRAVTGKVLINDVPQERALNFIPFYARHGGAFIDDIITGMRALDFNVAVFTE